MPVETLRVRTIDAHAGGGASRMVVGGLPALPGRTMLRKCAWASRHLDPVRLALLREPRGHAGLTGTVLTAPVTPGAVAGLVFMRQGGFGGVCGHGLIAAATIALERQLLVVPNTAPFWIDTTAGTFEVNARQQVRGGTGGRRACRVVEVRYRTPPVRIVQAAVPVIVGGRPVRVDVVWAPGYYGVVDRESVGLPHQPGVTSPLQTRAAEVIDILQPQVRNWTAMLGLPGRIEGIVFTGPPTRPDADLRSVTVYRDGMVDRSPSGPGTAAVLALLDAMGLVADGRAIGHEGGVGGLFRARVAERGAGETPHGIRAEISGEAWLTGEHTFLIDPDDPLRTGFTT